jgi:hypothetical protein
MLTGKEKERRWSATRKEILSKILKKHKNAVSKIGG